MKTQLLTLIIMLISGMNVVKAQEAILTSGGNASSDNGSVSYSVGQMVYTTITGTEGAVAQGVQQPYEISVSTAIKNTEDILLEFKAYPNPVKDNLRLYSGKHDINDMYYQLLDIKGKVIENKKITSIESSINMSGLSHGTYFLKVIYKSDTSSDEMKVFKITKK